MRGRDLDSPVQRSIDESCVKGLHSRDEIGDEELVSGGQNLVTHQDSDNVGGRNKGLDIGFEPLASEAKISEVGDLVVWDCDCDSNAGVSKGL